MNQILRVRSAIVSRLRRARFQGGMVVHRVRRPPAIIFPKLGAKGYGQLGNQLWQVAGTFGIAARLETEARFPMWRYANRFSIPEQHFISVDVLGLDASTISLHMAEEHRKYLQDPALWLHHEGTIRQYFTPNPISRADLQSRFSSILRIPDKTALHIRRGDYVNSEFHPTVSMAYLHSAVEQIAGSNIVVFSDDIPWCRDNLRWAKPVAFAEGNADYEDLFLMANCEHHIIANSSFSWWGAFLSTDRSPIYPVRWYGPGFRDIDPTLMFLDGWVGIDA